MAAPDSVLIAQLTDTHVLAGSIDLDNDDRLASAVASLEAEDPAPSVVLLTGDLVDDARPEQYERLGVLLEPLDIPTLALPGNHDDRDLVRATFPDTPWIDADHGSWTTAVGGVRIVGLDSTRPGEHGGEFDVERASWLTEVLAEPHEGVTILAMHHPPFVTGIDWMDETGFVGLDLFVEALESAPRIDRIVCGHLHRPIGSSVAGTPAQVGVATARHVALDLSNDSEVSMIDDPYGYQLHVVSGRSVTTHTRYVGTGNEAYVPDWAASF